MNRIWPVLMAVILLFGCRKKEMEPFDFPGFLLNGVYRMEVMHDGTVVAINGSEIAVLTRDGEVDYYDLDSRYDISSNSYSLQFMGNADEVYAVNTRELITMSNGIMTVTDIEGTISPYGTTTFMPDSEGNIIRTDFSTYQYDPGFGQYRYQIRLSKWDGYWIENELDLWVTGFNLPIYVHEAVNGEAFIVFEQYVFRGTFDWDGNDFFSEVSYSSQQYIPSLHAPRFLDNHLISFSSVLSSTATDKSVYDLDLATGEMKEYNMTTQSELYGINVSWSEVFQHDQSGARAIKSLYGSGDGEAYSWATYDFSDHSVSLTEYAYNGENAPDPSRTICVGYDRQAALVYFGTQDGLYRHNLNTDEFVFIPEMLLNEQE